MKNLVDKLIAYEMGDLTDEETLKLFKHLVKTGQAFSLQGHYGRTATALIREGKIKKPKYLITR